MTDKLWPWNRRTTYVWGRPISELEITYIDPVSMGLVKPHSPVRQLTIRPAWGDDHQRIESARRDNRSWLGKWEATLPPGSQEILPTLSGFRQKSQRQMQDSESLLMVIEADEEVIGLVSLGAVQHGAMSLGNLGYWVIEDWAGQGITSLAVASVIDLVLGELGLHRLEIVVRPENQASLALCRKLGLRHEGLRTRYMCIAGRWCDHVAFAIDQEMLRMGGLVETRIQGRRHY